MTTQEKLVNRKLSIIELAEFLKNVSQACRINGVSRQQRLSPQVGKGDYIIKDDINNTQTYKRHSR
jgi:hypothetical protein